MPRYEVVPALSATPLHPSMRIAVKMWTTAALGPSTQSTGPEGCIYSRKSKESRLQPDFQKKMLKADVDEDRRTIAGSSKCPHKMIKSPQGLQIGLPPSATSWNGGCPSCGRPPWAYVSWSHTRARRIRTRRPLRLRETTLPVC